MATHVIDKIPHLPTGLQKRLITIYQKINQINEEIDFYRGENKVLTYSESRHEKLASLNSNMDNNEELISKKSRIISKLIFEVLDKL